MSDSNVTADEYSFKSCVFRIWSKLSVKHWIGNSWKDWISDYFRNIDKIDLRISGEPKSLFEKSVWSEEITFFKILFLTYMETKQLSNITVIQQMAINIFKDYLFYKDSLIVNLSCRPIHNLCMMVFIGRNSAF